MAGIYVHIPFCKQACHYCDFHFSTNTKKRHELIDGITAELALQRSYLKGEKIQTIYFGGGTPSILPTADLENILRRINDVFIVEPTAEITLEANPDDLEVQKLRDLRTLGVNRLSIGIQSFDDAILKFLNRPHDTRQAINSFENARATGFQNVSIDLIYAIPGQDRRAWQDNIAKAIHLSPEHISSYSLTIEEKTVFGKWASQKKIFLPDNDGAAAELLDLADALEAQGYEHYEVSNFCKPNYLSRHNSSYWTGKKYLGAGPSAHSFDGTSRQFNVENNHLYVKSIQSGRVPATIEILSREDRINDWILTSLRTAWGVDLNVLENLQYDLLKTHGHYIGTLIKGNLAVLRDDRLILTKAGRLLADKIASDLFALAYP